jgi:ribose 5-phosphate isomerase A
MRSLDRDSLKHAAAVYAVRFVEPGTIVGLGTGSTAIHAVREIARRHAAGELPGLRCFATSSEVARAAEAAGLPLIDAEGPAVIDVTIDGADEVDPQLNLIKGGGGALLHEKIVAQATKREIIVVDEAKMSPQLGTLYRLPVEVIPFGRAGQWHFLHDLGGNPELRTKKDGTPYITDEGNYIYDCAFGPIADPEELGAELHARSGIVEHGLFLGMADDVIVAGQKGLRHLQRDPVSGEIREVAVE